MPRSLTTEQLARYLSASRVISWAVEVTADGYVPRWVSPNIEHVLGDRIEEALAPDFWAAHVHPDDRDRALAEWEEARMGRRDAQIYRVRHRDGHALWILDSMRYIAATADRPAEVVGAWTDITEQHRVEEALAESEGRFRLAIDAARQGLWDLDVPSDAVIVSDAYATMLGYDPATFRETHQEWLTRMPAEDRTRCEAAFKQVVQGPGTEYRIEFRQRTATGGIIWVQSVGRVVARDASGRAIRLIGTHTDVTTLKERAEQAQSVARFSELLLEHVNEAVVACDAVGQLSVFNRMARDWHGLGPDASLMPEEWADRYDLYEGDGRTPLSAARIPLQRAFAGESVREVPMCIAAPGQPLRRVIANGGPIIAADGSKLGALVLMRDVTAEYHAAAAVRLRDTALAAATVAIVITDHNGAIEWANPAFTVLTGYTLEESLGRNPRELVRSGKQSTEHYARMWDTILSGRTWQGELVNRRKDGTEYPEALTITPVRDADGSIAHFVAFKRDLTEEHAQRHPYLQSQKLESVGRLAGGIAHDFNNLLTVISGTVDLALAALRPVDPLYHDLTDIREAGERASALTRQLLAFSRQQVVRAEVVSVDEVISDLTKMVGRLIGEDIELKRVSAEEPWQVLADVGLLEQVVVNLCVNARDAMPRGGTLTIGTANVVFHDTVQTAHGTIPPGDYVCLRVADSGTGMSEEVLQRLFEPFFTTKEVGRGTGLGLATVYGIVQQSSGVISVESHVGVGSEFRIYLPRVVAAPRRRSTPVGGVQLTAGTGTLLVVDDEPMLRAIAARILSRAGYTVMTASSGPELYAELRERDPTMAVLFTSGYTEDTIIQHGMGGTELPFLHKPYSIAELSTMVHNLLADA
jgi:two-component system cell cycle sensor histidine kinase/response regulator CckA